MQQNRLTSLAKVAGLVVVVSAILFAVTFATSKPESKTVSLQVTDTGLSPNNVTVAVGQPVELNVENRTTQAHEIAVADIPLATSDEEHNMPGMAGMGGMAGDSMAMGNMAGMPPIHMMLGAGQVQSVTFTADKAGRYEFACLTPGHQERGVLFVND
jgi:uncharacterized cupredoxin-like copper-binding protein